MKIVGTGILVLFAAASAHAGEKIPQCFNPMYEGHCVSADVNGQKTVRMSQKTKKLLKEFDALGSRPFGNCTARYEVPSPVRGGLDIASPGYRRRSPTSVREPRPRSTSTPWTGRTWRPIPRSPPRRRCGPAARRRSRVRTSSKAIVCRPGDTCSPRGCRDRGWAGTVTASTCRSPSNRIDAPGKGCSESSRKARRLTRDVRHSLRTLGRHAGFTTVTVATLARSYPREHGDVHARRFGSAPPAPRIRTRTACCPSPSVRPSEPAKPADIAPERHLRRAARRESTPRVFSAPRTDRSIVCSPSFGENARESEWSIMCHRVTCRTCGKPTWIGCGRHVEQALREVPPEQRCELPSVEVPAVAPARTIGDRGQPRSVRQYSRNAKASAKLLTRPSDTRTAPASWGSTQRLRSS